MYRTGDLGVRRADGNVEYLGRRDDQMKIHGYRIEPAEVEAAIASHADVTQVVVAARHDEDGDSLVAYIERAPGGEVAARGLQDFLRPVLPAHMIPRLFRFVERVPLLPNGKTDRRRVMELEQGRETQKERVLPHERGLEHRVLAVWREVLGNDAIEPTDNFFDVGGDSVRLYAVYRRLLEIVGQHFPAVALFEYPTVRHCAEYLRTLRAGMREEPPAPRDDRDEVDLERQRLLAFNDIFRRGEAALEP
jgi:hypothetical protein